MAAIPTSVAIVHWSARRQLIVGQLGGPVAVNRGRTVEEVAKAKIVATPPARVRLGFGQGVDHRS